MALAFPRDRSQQRAGPMAVPTEPRYTMAARARAKRPAQTRKTAAPRGAREPCHWWRCRNRIAAIVARREAIVEDLRRLVGAEAVIADEDGRRAYETDALTAYRRLPLAVVLPASTEEVSRRAGLLPPARHQGGGARCRHVAFGRRAARRGRGGDRRRAHEPGARGRLHEPHRPRRGRHHQPRHQRRRQGARTSSTRPIRRASSPARSPATSA